MQGHKGVGSQIPSTRKARFRKAQCTNLKSKTTPIYFVGVEWALNGLAVCVFNEVIMIIIIVIL